METSQELYEIRRQLMTIVAEKIDEGIGTYISKHKNDIRYFLHYPLVNIELGLDNEPAENIENGMMRDVFGFLIFKTFSLWNDMEYKNKVNTKGFSSYCSKSNNTLHSIWHDYLTLMKIKDGNSYAKSRIEKINEKKYKLTTSLVTHKYKEEGFYFYGADNSLQQENEKNFILANTIRFYHKYFPQIQDIPKLLNEVDHELLTYCKDRVMVDLSKLHFKTKSSVFSSIDELANVLSFLYYIAFVKNMKRKMYKMIDADLCMIEDCIIQFPKVWLIKKIANLYQIKETKVNAIISYFTNNGTPYILEFPLFEHKNIIITIPSLIIINDWAFTVPNGHYVKNIDFKKRKKTLSVSTEVKLEKALENVENVLFCKEKYYECFNENQKKINSDIDFAIFDYSKNILFVIESKWKDNHYYCGSEKNHPKIQDTLNKIFKEQIEKHKIFLSNPQNILSLFNNDCKVNLQQRKVEIYYIAIDKRNQLHLNDNHMITEYMLLYFIEKHIDNNKLDIDALINTIEQMYTKTEYISIDPTMEISLNSGDVIQIDEADLSLKYKFN